MTTDRKGRSSDRTHQSRKRPIRATRRSFIARENRRRRKRGATMRFWPWLSLVRNS